MGNPYMSNTNLYNNPNSKLEINDISIVSPIEIVSNNWHNSNSEISDNRKTPTRNAVNYNV